MESCNLKLYYETESDIDYMLTELENFLMDFGISFSVEQQEIDYVTIALSRITMDDLSE